MDVPKMKCAECYYPDRKVWTLKSHPDFAEIKLGNWIIWVERNKCKQLWCEVPHEPYASFTFWTAWPYSKSDWEKLNAIDNALILHEWHDHVIKENYETLPKDEKEAVESWRNRTLRNYNAIDRTSNFKHCKSSTDIKKYLDK